MTTTFPDLVEGEAVLPPLDSALVMRHVHPAFVDEGAPSSQAFTPTSKDRGCLSVIQRDLVEPVNAHMDHTITLGLQSIGIWAVTTGEAEASGSRAVDDSETSSADPDSLLPPGHAYLDFRDLSGASRKEKRRAQVLKRYAIERGCVYRPS